MLTIQHVPCNTCYSELPLLTPMLACSHSDVLPTDALELDWRPLSDLIRKFHMVRMRDAVKVGTA